MVLKKVSHVKYWWAGTSLGPPDNSSDLPNFQLRSEGRVEARLGNCYDRSTVGYGCCAGLFRLGGHDLLSPLAAEGDTGMTRESREGETVNPRTLERREAFVAHGKTTVRAKRVPQCAGSGHAGPDHP